MTDQTPADLIAASETWTPAEVHASPVGAARIIESLAAALETAEQRAKEAERERDRLDEAFDRDLPWRYDEVEAQRNQLAAVVEKVRAWADEAIGYGEPSGDTVSDLLATTPADALREHDAALIEGLADEIRHKQHAESIRQMLREKARQRREEKP